MYFILLLSIYGVTIIIDRLYYIYRASFNYKMFLLDIKKMILDRDVEHAMALLRRTPGPLGEILSQTLNLVSSGTADLRTRVSEIGNYEIQKAEGRLKHLALIGNIAPMLGLLGTVTGMITAFSAIALKGANNPTIVAGGISEALLTTAYGLIVAIPMVFAYNYLSSRYESLVLETERATGEFVDFIEKGTK